MAQTTILIVDDTAQVRHELNAVLPLAGNVQVVGEAADGDEAIRQVEALHPDVVLMDLEMPVLNGYAAVRAIKARHPACRVIALSVHSYHAAREQAAQAGADDFVEKGAPLDALIRAIEGRK